MLLYIFRSMPLSHRGRPTHLLVRHLNIESLDIFAIPDSIVLLGSIQLQLVLLDGIIVDRLGDGLLGVRHVASSESREEKWKSMQKSGKGRSSVPLLNKKKRPPVSRHVEETKALGDLCRPGGPPVMQSVNSSDTTKPGAKTGSHDSSRLQKSGPQTRRGTGPRIKARWRASDTRRVAAETRRGTSAVVSGGSRLR